MTSSLPKPEGMSDGMVNIQMAKQFLEAYFPDLNGEHIELLGLDDATQEFRAQKFFTSVDALCASLPQTLQKQHNCGMFFGACPRSRRSGDADSVTRAPSYRLDFDAKDCGGNLEVTRQAVEDFITLTGVRPTFRVFTRRGYQVHWLFNEPLDVSTPEARAKYKQTLKRMAIVAKADLGAIDLGRRLRLPGTFHLKDPSKPHACTLTESNPEHRVNPDDFDMLADVPLSDSQPVVAEKPASLVAGTLADLHEGNRHTGLVKVAGKLRQGSPLGEEDIFALLQPYAQACGQPLSDLRQIASDMAKKPAGFPITDYRSTIGTVNGCREAESNPPIVEPTRLRKLLAQGVVALRWAVGGLLPESGVAVFAADPGHGKSFLLMALSLDVALGIPWLGHTPFVTQRGGVLYLDAEMGLRRVAYRYGILLRGRGANDVDVWVQDALDLNLSNPGHVQALEKWLRDLCPRVVIVDPMIRVLGVKDENNSVETSAAMKPLRRIASELNLLFIFAHHLKKPPGHVVDEGSLLRGSTDILASVDVALRVKKTLDGLYEVRPLKSRDSESLSPFLVSFQDEGGDPNKAIRISYTGDAEAHREELRSRNAIELVRAILKDSPDHEFTFKELQDMASESKVSRKSLKSALEELVPGEVTRQDRRPESGKGGKTAFYQWSENGRGQTEFNSANDQEDAE